MQWSGAQHALRDVFRGATTPLVKFDFMLCGTFDTRTEIAMQMRPHDRVRLAWLAATPRGQRQGGVALDWLCGLADRHGQSIELHAVPMAKRGTWLTDAESLREWYARRGFSVIRGNALAGWMERGPRA